MHSASIQDRHGAKKVLGGLSKLFPTIGPVWVDDSYVDVGDQPLIGWAADQLRTQIVAIPRTADSNGCQVLPRRWVVERTLHWIERSTVGTRRRTQDRPR